MSIKLNSLLKPGLFFPKKHIFLISHMRANTSLFGHLLGSSDEVSGYYEMHIGYYSWKSLIRQKLLYHSMHPSEPVTKYYFDKILHSEHRIRDEIINHKNFEFIFMLREPERTVKSICKLYQGLDPKHELATGTGASQYYMERVYDIGKLFDKINDKRNCCYLDAECLISKTDESLAFLTEKMNFNKKLSSEYKRFQLTGEKRFGDSSSNINSGHIVSSNKDKYKDINIDDRLLEKCEQVYHEVRNNLVNNCYYSLVK